MSSRVLDFEKYTAKARQAVAEGQVLLINEEHTLPLQKGTRLAMLLYLAECSFIIIRAVPDQAVW